MITKQDAMTRSLFHYGECTRVVGPRGGVTIKIEAWRASGRCKTWKTRPTEFSLPVKYGMYTSGYITTNIAHAFHLPEDCPLN